MNRESRRDFFATMGKLGTGAALAALSAAAFSGCGVDRESIRKLDDGCAATAKELNATNAALEKIPQAAGVERLAARCEQTRAALTSARGLLVESRHIGSGYAIHVWHLLYAEDFAIPDGEQVEFEKLRGVSEMRTAAKQLRVNMAACCRSLCEEFGAVDSSTRGGRRPDPLQGALMASLSARLPVLADRLDDKTLLADDNIVNHWHKTGSTSSLIGRTEHLSEAIAELDQLLRTLRPQAEGNR